MLKSPTAWQHNVKIDLVPNTDYKGPRKPKNGGLTLSFYQSSEAAYNDLLAGSLDVLEQVPPSALRTYKTDLGDRAVNQPAAVFQSFTIPENLAALRGKEGALRRQAISDAIDRPTITKVIFQDTRTPATDFTSPIIAGYSDGSRATRSEVQPEQGEGPVGAGRRHLPVERHVHHRLQR